MSESAASFTIPGRLPSFNEYIAQMNRAWYIGQSFKNKQVKIIGQAIIAAKIPKFTKPVVMGFLWVERDRRRDRDNIRSGEKYVMDALKRTQRIQNDTQKWVLDSLHKIEVDPANPHVQVTITEAA